MAPLAAATSIILLVQNVLTKEFLTYDGSAAAMHSTRIDQGNFHLFTDGIGTGRTLQVFADSSIRIGLNNNFFLESEKCTFGSGDINIDEVESQCTVAARVGFLQDQWYIEQESGMDNSGVRLYLVAEDGKKWYLRAHFQGRRVDLVCEDYVNSISNMQESFFSEHELRFDFVASNIMDIMK